MQEKICSISGLFLIKTVFLNLWSWWPCGDCTFYQRHCEAGAEKMPRASTTISAYCIWTQIGPYNWWEVFDVCVDPSLRRNLLNLSLNCSSVVCCWVSPLQKAQVNLLIMFSYIWTCLKYFVLPNFWVLHFIEIDW